MFERYNQEARRSIFFARYEASQFGARCIEAEHLLLGLLRQMHLPCDAIRAEIIAISPHATPTPTSVDLPVSLAVKRTMAFAAEEATKLGHAHIGPEHLLLGLMVDQPDSLVPGLLKKHGIDREKALSNLTDAPAETVDRESVKALVDSVPQERLRNAKQILESLGPGDTIQSEVTRTTPRAAPVNLRVSPWYSRAWAFAAEEAERLGHQHVGVEHLLLGLLRDGRGPIVPTLLEKHGIDREKVLAAIADAPAEAPIDRDSVKALIDSLPAGALPGVKQMLEHMQIPRPLPPPPPFGAEGGWFGGGGGGAIGWNFTGPGTGDTPMRRMRQGRRSLSRMENGAEVVETHHLREGCEIILIERFRLSEDGKTLSYTQEITGPGKSEQHTIDFNVADAT